MTLLPLARNDLAPLRPPPTSGGGKRCGDMGLANETSLQPM